MRLGVIASQFPRYDEAFLLRDITALAHGVECVRIFSLKPCRDRVIHAQAQALLPQTVSVPFLWSRTIWRSHLYFLRHAPRAYGGALGWIISRHWKDPMILANTLSVFPKTVHMAHLALAERLTHLHACWATYPATCALVICRLTGIPYSLSGHAHDIYCVNPALREKILNAKFIVTCTEVNKRHLEKLLNGHERADVRMCGRADVSALGHPHIRTSAHIVVNYHGIDLAKFSPVPKPVSDVCHLLAVGRLDASKGLEILIEACRRLRTRGMSFRCTIAGDGPWDPRLRRLIARDGLADYVQMIGSVSQDTVVRLYQEAHLFILPLAAQIHWGIPNVLIEALATKTPVITCDLPSMRELIEHGRSGWVLPRRDARQLAEAIETLWRDAPHRAALAEAGYQRVVERFSLEQTGQRLRDIFAEGQGENGVEFAGSRVGELAGSTRQPTNPLTRNQKPSLR